MITNSQNNTLYLWQNNHMKKVISILLICISLANTALSQRTSSVNPDTTIEISLEERLNALELETQQMNQRLSKFENQHHVGREFLFSGILASAIGVVLITNQEIAGKKPAFVFGGLGFALGAAGSICIIDAPRHLRIPIEE
jgi:hypothetical protein